MLKRGTSSCNPPIPRHSRPATLDLTQRTCNSLQLDCSLPTSPLAAHIREDDASYPSRTCLSFHFCDPLFISLVLCARCRHYSAASADPS